MGLMCKLLKWHTVITDYTSTSHHLTIIFLLHRKHHPSCYRCSKKPFSSLESTEETEDNYIQSEGQRTSCWLDLFRLLLNSWCSADTHNDNSLTITTLSADCAHQKQWQSFNYHYHSSDWLRAPSCVVITDIIRQFTINNDSWWIILNLQLGSCWHNSPGNRRLPRSFGWLEGFPLGHQSIWRQRDKTSQNQKHNPSVFLSGQNQLEERKTIKAPA